jgi:hypothetical protein
MRFEPALDCESKIVNYSFSIRTQNAYMLSKKQLAKQFPEGSDDPFLAAGQEFVSKDIPFAIELFKLQVEFPDGYQVNPQSVVYFGRESRKEGLKIPPDSFHFNGNKAILEVHRPLLYHRYAITWELPS